MCGILGYRAFSDRRPTWDILAKMFAKLSVRGTDAAGFAIRNTATQVQVIKQPGSSVNLVNSTLWTDFIRDRVPPIAMIFHCRAATHGEAIINANNHPLTNSRLSIALVHNGTIHNATQLRLRFAWPNHNEVDSEALLAILARHPRLSVTDRVRKIFAEADGSWACAVIFGQSDSVLLFRHHSPLDLIYDPRDDIIYFVSENHIVTDCLDRQQIIMRGLSIWNRPVYVSTLADDHSAILRSAGLSDLTKHKSTAVIGTWSSSDRTWVKCPHCCHYTLICEPLTYAPGKPPVCCVSCKRVLLPHDLKDIPRYPSYFAARAMSQTLE